MNIEALGENKIVIELTENDMITLDITYEDMDYSNIETRRVIWTLLDRAKQILGRDIDPSGKLLIEAMPKPEGGCTLYFTVQGEMKSVRPYGKMRIKKDKFCFVCEFENFDNLYECIKNLSTITKETLGGSLFESNGAYRLIVSTDGETESLKSYFSEYGRLFGEGILCASYTKEHWSLLVKDSALEALSAV